MTAWTVFDDIEQWGRNRGLIGLQSDCNAQMVKGIEEFGELASGIARGDQDLIADSIGDVAVVLTILAAQRGLSFMDCVRGAYGEIAKRKGVMRDGFFRKEGD